jgi:hypothetical protein
VYREGLEQRDEWSSAMNGIAARIVRVGSGFGALLILGWVLVGHAAGPAKHGLPTDWSHRHVIFSQPVTAAQAKRVGADPRFWQQWDRRNSVRPLAVEPPVPVLRFAEPGARTQPKMRRDWSQDLGSGGSVGAANFPAKYSFDVSTATCSSAPNPDYVVFNTGLTGSTSQATIAAYDNLYSGCTGTVPSVYWAYNILNAGAILTSPVFSLDGTQIASVGSNDVFGTLVLLKWAASTTQTVASPKPLAPSPSYTNCTAPCMTEIILQDNLGAPVDDQTSSVFYDYGHDIAWVGGAGGWLHKISPVFKGTLLNPPAEVTTGGFPVQVNGGAAALSSPVYDSRSNTVFVGDLGGFLYRVDPTTGSFVKSGQLDAGVGLVSGPIVDSTSGLVYAFASNNGTTNCAGGTGPCSSVYVFPTNFAAGSIATDVAVGGSVPVPAPLYEGAFDNAYLNSTNATGNLYVCGNTGQRPIMYKVPVNAGVMGPIVTGPALATTTANCSPVTDVFNPNSAPGPSEWIYAGASTAGFGNSCAAGGCLISFENMAWTPNTVYAVGQEILDTTFQIQVVRKAGTSGATVPAWNTTRGGSTPDGPVLRWVDQGTQSPSHGFWLTTHAFALGVGIVDSNNNIQAVIVAGTSGGTVPVWETAVNANTLDGSVLWKNVGSIATFSLPATNGTSGIIIDNVVTTPTGASQVYYTTLGDQTCGTSGTGGCAVQASQAALQ